MGSWEVGKLLALRQTVQPGNPESTEKLIIGAKSKQDFPDLPEGGSSGHRTRGREEVLQFVMRNPKECLACSVHRTHPRRQFGHSCPGARPPACVEVQGSNCDVGGPQPRLKGGKINVAF